MNYKHCLILPIFALMAACTTDPTGTLPTFIPGLHNGSSVGIIGGSTPVPGATSKTPTPASTATPTPDLATTSTPTPTPTSTPIQLRVQGIVNVTIDSIEIKPETYLGTSILEIFHLIPISQIQTGSTVKMLLKSAPGSVAGEYVEASPNEAQFAAVFAKDLVISSRDLGYASTFFSLSRVVTPYPGQEYRIFLAQASGDIFIPQYTSGLLTLPESCVVIDSKNSTTYVARTPYYSTYVIRYKYLETTVSAKDLEGKPLNGLIRENFNAYLSSITGFNLAGIDSVSSLGNGQYRIGIFFTQPFGSGYGRNIYITVNNAPGQGYITTAI